MRSIGYSKTLTALIIFFSLFAIGLPVKRTDLNAQQSQISPLSVLVDNNHTLLLGKRWMGIYLKNSKVGYCVTNIQEDYNSYQFSERIVMKLNLMGTPQAINIITKSTLEKNFSIKSFRFLLQSGVVKFQARGRVAGGNLELYVNSRGREIQETIPLKTPPFLPNNLNLALFHQGLAVGKVCRFHVFDPSTMSNDETIISIEGKESIKISGEKTSAYILKESFKGLVVTAWISEEGTMLKEESPLGLVLVKETEEEALTKGWDSGFVSSGTDIISYVAIPVDILVEQPKSVKYMKIKLSGISLSDFNLTSGEQVLKGDILEITKEEIMGINSYFMPLKEKGFEKYLEPSLLIQSNDQRIVEEANRIIGEEKNAIRISKMIMEWVYENVEKKPTISIPSAIDVLQLKMGDCNEHAALFTALNRAVGIPTKMITGIVLSEQKFYYHTWAEVYIGRWASIDPTMKQFPVDATHIRFVEGGLDKQVEIMKLIGHLKAEILEFK